MTGRLKVSVMVPSSLTFAGFSDKGAYSNFVFWSVFDVGAGGFHSNTMPSVSYEISSFAVFSWSVCGA